MTYGEVAAELREALTRLLAHCHEYSEFGEQKRRRNLVDDQELEAPADLVQRYRAVVWQYALHMARAAVADRDEDWDLAGIMVQSMEKAGPQPDRLPAQRRASMRELATVPDNAVAELWRRAAVAALTGRERDAHLVIANLTNVHRLVVLKDIADLTRAIIRLDDRYAELPGWAPRGLPTRPSGSRPSESRPRPTDLTVELAEHAQSCSRWAAARIRPGGYSVDHLGYYPKPTLMSGLCANDVDGAIRALRNSAICLSAGFPRAQVLRSILHAHWAMSLRASELATNAGEAGLAEHFTERGVLYVDLLGATVNIAGNLGGGEAALADSHTALQRMADARTATPEQLRTIHRVFRVTDHRISRIVCRGAQRHIYLMNFGTKVLGTKIIGGIRRAVVQYMPITKDNHPDLYRIAESLRPEPPSVGPKRDWVAARKRFSDMLDRQPHNARFSEGLGVVVQGRPHRRTEPDTRRTVAR